MCYRETGDIRYLKFAEKIADFILKHKNMPDDLIPYWDLLAPNIPNEPRDVSAAAIIASALYELSEFSLENRILIQQLCDELTPLQKEVIFARYIQGYSAAEVANQKKISRQAVNRIENRVKRKLHTNS